MAEHFSKLNLTAAKAEGVLLKLSKAASTLTGLDKRGNSLARDRYGC